MIASSRKVKLAAAVLALSAHGGALLAVMPPMMQAEMEGMSGGNDLALGTDFSDMAVGTLSTDPTEDVTETVEPETQEPVEPEPVQPAQVTPPQPATPTEAEPLDQQIAALPVVPPLEAEPVVPLAPEQTPPEELPETLEAIPPQAAETPEPERTEPIPEEPETLTAEAPETEPLEPEEEQPEEVTETAPEQSPRPKQRSPELAQRPEPPQPAPQPQRKPEPEPEPRRQAAQPQGNSDRNATAGAATGRAGGTSATSGSGGRAQEAGNAAASNYPGQVMRKLSRVPRPRVNARGAAVIAFRVSGSGGIAGLSVARSSGSSALDQAALRVVRSASPFPAPPAGAQTSFTVQIKGR